MNRLTKKSCIIILIGILFILITTVVIAGGNRNNLYSTWTLVEGEFELDGYSTCIEIREGDVGTIKFMKNGMYIFNGPSYRYLFGSTDSTYSGSYQIIDDGTLIMECDGYSNTMKYSINDGHLTLENRNGIGYWKK